MRNGVAFIDKVKATVFQACIIGGLYNHVAQFELTCICVSAFSLTETHSCEVKATAILVTRCNRVWWVQEFKDGGGVVS